MVPWIRETLPADGLGPLAVKINAHPDEVEGLPPYHILIDHPGGLVPVALFSPGGGAITLIGGEDALIRHFQEQPRHA